MFRRTLLLATMISAVSMLGNQAEASFSITTALTTDTTPAGLNLTYTTGSLQNAPAPTPTGGISFNFLNLNYGGSTFTGSGVLTLAGTFSIDNNGATGTGSFTEMLSYNLSNGYGNLSVVSSSISAGPIAGVSFAPILFASPTLSDGAPSTGNLSSVVSAAVPEPASLSMLGLGVAALGFVASRRRAA